MNLSESEALTSRAGALCGIPDLHGISYRVSVTLVSSSAMGKKVLRVFSIFVFRGSSWLIMLAGMLVGVNLAFAEDVAGVASGWERAALDNFVRYVEGQRSTALIVVQDDAVIVERHWPNLKDPGRPYQNLRVGVADGQAVEDVASVQKSVVAILVLMAVERDLIGLDQPISAYLGAGWSKASDDAELAITVRHLLSMTSGLATDHSFVHPAGEDWAYNARAYSRLIDVLAEVSGSDINLLTRRWLTGPLDMDATEWIGRDWLPAELDASRIGLATTAGDLVRFAQFMLKQGQGPSGRLLSSNLLAQVAHPSQELNPAYGWLWWLNGQPLTDPSGQPGGALAATAPADLFAAQGALGRKVYVVPSMNLVAVRLGDNPEPDFNEEFWRHLMVASPLESICDPCGQPVASQLSRARSEAGEFISWREHVIDDPSLGVSDLSGSDGLVLADLNNDGVEDIVSVHESDTTYDGQPIGHVRIAWGTQTPHRWQLTTLASGVEAAAAEDATVADFNADGFLDVVVACELAHLIYFENPGDGNTATPWARTILDISRNRGSYIRAFAADFDGDGRPEIVAANKGEQNPDVQTQALNPISLYLPGADPLVGADWREQVLGTVRIPINSEPVDLDGDGDIDVVAGSRGEARVLWFENIGDLQFEQHDINLPGFPDTLALTGFNMDYADLTDDGRVDIVSTAWPGAIVLLIQPQSHDEDWAWRILGSAPPDQLVSVRLGDIDGDQDLDVFAGAYSRGLRDRDDPLLRVDEPMGRISWFENPGVGSPSANAWTRHDVSRRKRGMYDKWIMRDLDADGDLDVLGTRGNSEPYDGVIWLEQIRTEEQSPAFIQARAIDSQQMPLGQ